MRDYLKLHEIKEILENHLGDIEFEAIFSEVKNEAETCLCAAFEPSECCCGAWDDEDWDDFFDSEPDDDWYEDFE